MADIFIGSHMKAEQTSDPRSSLLPGEKPKRGTVVKTIMGANVDGVSAGAGDWQTRKLAPGNVPTHPSMRSRSGEGGTIPSKTNRPKK